MPIVAHSDLPSFAALAADGEPILGLAEARRQDIRELHVGLLNLMPDAALQVTEQQYIRLIGGSNAIVQLFVHPFTVDGVERGPQGQAHIDTHYETFDQVREGGLDALIISGANVEDPDLTRAPFWEPLGEVAAWADEHVTSTICSCLASHALIQRRYGVERRRMLNKRWGVVTHKLTAPNHPLVRGSNTRFDAPHSRWNTLAPGRLRDAGVQVLAETLDGGFHLGTSPDGLRTVYLQGHPEYDVVSLLKEYKRELSRFVAGELEGSPPFPDAYIPDASARILTSHLEDIVAASLAGTAQPEFPEAEVVSHLDNTWADTGRALFSNWLGLVYRLTDHQRGVPFMDGVDRDDPLGLGS
jgi:homoserine O-succinyltransferase